MTNAVLGGAQLGRAQAERLVELGGEDALGLFRSASRIRERFLGNRVRCCSIAAAKVGRCSEDCAFCSQSAHYDTHLEGLTVLEPDEVFRAAMEAAANGAESFGIVSSGYKPTDGELAQCSQTIRRLRSANAIRVCASLGVLGEEQANDLARAGVQRYNHNLQTSRRHFPDIVSTHTYDDRLETLGHLRSAGISICSGALFGMGETWADRLDLAFDLREVDPDVVPINFLIPIDGTPLAGRLRPAPLAPTECLRIIALFRFLFPTRQIKIAGGREHHLRDLQSWMFLAGADSFLIGNYLTTCGRSPEADRRMVGDLGLELDGYAGQPCVDTTTGLGTPDVSQNLNAT